MLCKTTLAVKDKNGWPTPGTDRYYGRVPCGCDQVELPYTQMTPGGGEVQSFHPGGLRFFYRVNCDIAQTIPFTLFTATKHPGDGVLEWKKFVTV